MSNPSDVAKRKNAEIADDLELIAQDALPESATPSSLYGADGRPLAQDMEKLQGDVNEMMRARRDQLEVMVRERPLVTLLGAFAVGYIIGKLR
jgi:hypothetical protein